MRRNLPAPFTIPPRTARATTLLVATIVATAFLGSDLRAAPAPVGPATPPSPQLREEAQTAANYLVNVASRVQEAALRPIAPGELLEPAVRAWYEAARIPLPPGLAAEFKAAREDTGRLTSLIARHRIELGEMDALAGPRGLVIALQAAGKSIDPYSGPAPPNRVFVGRGDETTTGGGFELAFDNDLLTALAPALPNPAPAPGRVPAPPWRVQHVSPGGPAQKAGLRPDDVIVQVNGQAPDQPAASAALAALMPPPIRDEFIDPANLPPARPDAKVTLTVRRDGRETPFDVKVVGGSFVPETVFGVRRGRDGSWDFWADREKRIAYIRIGAIGRQTPEQLYAALGRLRGEARGLVLDLRWCPGGYLNQAIDLVRPFLKEGEIATSVSRDPRDPSRTNEITSTYKVEFHDAELSALPLIVLTGPETSGGGELLAAALQDNGRATIAGARTRGKGSIQTELSNALPGISFKVTSGRFVRPSRKNLDRTAAGTGDEWGVKPDKGCDLPVTPELARRLKQDWILLALRPGESKEALALDEPGHDPQYAGAVRMMARKLEAAKKPE